jgi:hypothetical protein
MKMARNLLVQIYKSQELISDLKENFFTKKSCILEIKKSQATQFTCHGFTMTLIIYALKGRSTV